MYMNYLNSVISTVIGPHRRLVIVLVYFNGFKSKIMRIRNMVNKVGSS